MSDSQNPGLSPALRALTGRLDKRAFGFAMGAVGALAVFLLTLLHLVSPREGSGALWLLQEYFYGYELSWTGLLVGTLWGAWVGFFLGWFLAFTRNLMIGLWLFVVRARGQLAANRDILDQI